MKLSFHDEESFKETAGSLHFNNPPSDPISLQRVESSNSMPPQERGEDICFNDPSLASDPNTMPVGNSSSMPPQERSEVIEIY